eukprot:SAG11_NODE_3294_length_2546_cov_1.591745_3_plen_57_part_01
MLSNTAAARLEEGLEGRPGDARTGERSWFFGRTPRMSTYLLALAAGELEELAAVAPR